MHKNHQKIILMILAGMAVGALSYWLNRYNELNVAGVPIHLILFLGSLLVSFLLKVLMKSKTWTLVGFISLGTILSVFGRIFYDIQFVGHPYDNLVPLEVLFASALAFSASLTGVFIAKKSLKIHRG